MRCGIFVCWIAFVFPSLLRAELYNPGDWITYGDFRYVTAVLPARNILYALTDRGVLRYDRLADKWEYPWTASTGLPQKSWRIAGYQMLGDKLWLVSPDSSFCYYNAVYKRWVTNENPPERFDQVPTALPLRLSAYMCETPGYRFAPEGRYLEDNLFRQFPLAGMEQDERGNHWLAFPGVGIARLPYRSLKIALMPYGLNRTDATSIAFDAAHGEWWFAGLAREGGITVWDTGNDRWQHYDPRLNPDVPTGKINDLVFDSTAAWLACDRGLVRVAYADKRWRTYTTFDGLGTDVVTCIAKDGEHLWAGTLTGLAQVTSSSALITRVGERTLADLPIHDVAVDSTTVWMVAESGVYLYHKNRNNAQWEALRDPQGKLEFHCTCVMRDDTLAWFAGRDFAATYDPEHQAWEYFLPPYAFAPCTIWDMAVDSENVWFATDRGALKFHKKYRRWRYYTTADGLAHDFVGTVRVVGDYVWFGTRAGVTKFFWKRPHRVD